MARAIALARGHVKGAGAFRASLVAASLLASAPAHAYRPFDGTDADVAPPGVFELELGPVHYFREASQNFLIAPALVLNLGILDRTELVVDADDFVALGTLRPGVDRVSVQGDDVLVKHVFREGTLQDGSGPSIAAEGGVLLPFVPGDVGLGATLDIIGSYRFRWGTAHLNELVAYSRAHRADLFTDVIVEGPYDWTVRPVAEGFFEDEIGGVATASLLFGAIWRVSDSLSFDAGIRGARSGGDDDVEARLGLTWSVAIAAPRNAETAALIDGGRGP